MAGSEADTASLRVPQASYGVDRKTIRGYRITGAVFAILGALMLTAMVALALSRGDFSLRLLLAAVPAPAFLIGGIFLWAQHYPSGPAAVRRATAGFSVASAPLGIANSLQYFAAGYASATDIWSFLMISGLVLGASLLVIGSLSLWSRRYASWFDERYRRRWEKRESRRAESLKRA